MLLSTISSLLMSQGVGNTSDFATNVDMSADSTGNFVNSSDGQRFNNSFAAASSEQMSQSLQANQSIGQDFLWNLMILQLTSLLEENHPAESSTNPDKPAAAKAVVSNNISPIKPDISSVVTAKITAQISDSVVPQSNTFTPETFVNTALNPAQNEVKPSIETGLESSLQSVDESNKANITQAEEDAEKTRLETSALQEKEAREALEEKNRAQAEIEQFIQTMRDLQAQQNNNSITFQEAQVEISRNRSTQMILLESIQENDANQSAVAKSSGESAKRTSEILQRQTAHIVKSKHKEKTNTNKLIDASLNRLMNNLK